MAEKLIVAIGEILYDRFEDRDELGGAPTNFAGHVAALGGRAALISAVGDDDLGHAALEQLRRRGLDLSGVTVNSLPTGTVDVALRGGQPDYTINRPAAWDAIELNDAAREILVEAALVCFGTLAQRDERSRSAVQEAVRLAPPGAYRLLDVNLRKPLIEDSVIADSVALADAVKLNDEEVPHVARILGLPSDVKGFAAGLRESHGVRVAFVTCGAAGAHLFRDEEYAWVNARPVARLISTVGAGDSFTAAAAIGLLDAAPLDVVGSAAVELAAKTCSHAGGLPPV